MAIIHQVDGLGIVSYSQEWCHRSEGFFPHGTHSVIDVHQNLRGKIRRAVLTVGKSSTVNQRPGSLGDRFRYLLPNRGSRPFMNNRSQGGLRMERIIQSVLVGEFDKTIDKFPPHILMDVDPFHGAAGLPRIEKDPLDQILGGLLEKSIRLSGQWQPFSNGSLSGTYGFLHDGTPISVMGPASISYPTLTRDM